MAGNRSKTPTEEHPRPRRAASWLITHPFLSTALDAGRTIPLPLGHQGLPHTRLIAPRLRKLCDVDHIVRHLANFPRIFPVSRELTRRERFDRDCTHSQLPVRTPLLVRAVGFSSDISGSCPRPCVSPNAHWRANFRVVGAFFGVFSPGPQGVDFRRALLPSWQVLEFREYRHRALRAEAVASYLDEFGQ